MKKKISIVMLTVVCVLLVLSSCGQSAVKDISLSDLVNAVEKVVSAKDDMANFDLDTMQSFYSDIDPNLVTEYKAMRTVQGTSADQFGVFICKDETSAKEFVSQLESGIKNVADSASNFNYTPEELPKLQNAKVISAGKYVMYAILSDSERGAAVSAFNALVK